MTANKMSLPKWAEEAAEKYTEPYDSLCSAAEYCKHDVRCAFLAGVRLVLERIEKTRLSDDYAPLVGQSEYDAGRESIRKEVLGD